MTLVDDPWIVHVAGAPIGAIQRCDSCGHVLQDNTAWYEGRVAVPVDQSDRGPAWFATGQRIAELGNCSVALPDRPLEDDERLCAGAN